MFRQSNKDEIRAIRQNQIVFLRKKTNSKKEILMSTGSKIWNSLLTVALVITIAFTAVANKRAMVPGPQGETGPQGPAGTSVTVEDVLASPEFQALVDQKVAEALSKVTTSDGAELNTDVLKLEWVPITPLSESQNEGGWTVSYYDGYTDQMAGWFANLATPQPVLWPNFPNVDNSDVGFVAANGLEYGLDESVFMEQNELGNFPVQARGYRLISGDYNLPGYDKCDAESAGAGCAVAIFDVGEVTADIEAWVRQGFTVSGRYWNGDTLEQAMWGLASHTSANMLNMSTNGVEGETLNDPSRTNAGSNCSVPEACARVRFTIVITSGNQLLVKATTFVTAPE